MSFKQALALLVGVALPTDAAQAQADAPELAAPGPFGVGYRALKLVHHRQPDLMGAGQWVDRAIGVDLWYPAQKPKKPKSIRYHAQLWGEPPAPPKAFTLTGWATPNVRAAGTHHPLVIVSHGYSNSPVMMSWLTENLASKGYVVAAIRHQDPNPYLATPAVRAAPFFYRPTDIRFVADRLRDILGQDIDGDAIALIGYSQGGYGVLAAGGASLDPAHPLMDQVAGGALRSIARNGPAADRAKLPEVKAIVALAPAGGGSPDIWGEAGLKDIKAPLLLIAGDADPVVGYRLAAKSFFDRATQSDRYLLTYRQAGHAIATNPVPAEMQGSLWDMDWFEDPIWRQARLNALNLHFITAFLDLNLRHIADRQAYLDVPVSNSDDGQWDAPKGTPWGALSPGGPGVTLWKGFPQRHARGMTLEHRQPD